MGLLVVFFALSIMFSFLCSIWEAVILSITPTYTHARIEEGRRMGRLLQQYKEDIDRPLSAILSLNTIAHTVGAIGVGAQAGRIFGSSEIDLGIMAVSYESVIAGGMTLAILILSEIIPKTIGANMWQRLAPFTIKSIRILLIVLAPLVWLSQLITRGLKKDKNKSVFNRSDFTVMTRAGLESGAIDKSESTVIQNLLRLEKLSVASVMTPRSVILMAEERETVQDFYAKHKHLAFSRIPIYRGEQDQVTGFVLKDDILTEIAEDRHTRKLQDIRRDVLLVNARSDLDTILSEFIKHQEHMAIAIDEFGSVVGLVSMEDVFETLLGLEIVDESDNVENLQEYARAKWEKRSKHMRQINVQETDEEMNSDQSGEEENEQYS